MFSGVVGAPGDASFPDPTYTTVEKTPVSREKPYLYVDDAGAYFVRVPSAQKESSGVSWSAGETAGRSIPIPDFYIAKPGDSAQVINTNLARGKHLLLTPGRLRRRPHDRGEARLTRSFWASGTQRSRRWAARFRSR